MQIIKFTWSFGLIQSVIATVKTSEKMAYHCQDDILVSDCLSPFSDKKVPSNIRVKYFVNKHVEELA